MDYYEYVEWHEYIFAVVTDKELAKYIGEFERNYIESAVDQWFRGVIMDAERERILKIRYCTRMWLLQEIAGCTFMEARIYLRRERNETREKLMGIYSLDEDSYAGLLASAERKVAEAGSEGDLFRRYTPIYPGRSETPDWRPRPDIGRRRPITEFPGPMILTGMHASPSIRMPNLSKTVGTSIGPRKRSVPSRSRIVFQVIAEGGLRVPTEHEIGQEPPEGFPTAVSIS